MKEVIVMSEEIELFFGPQHPGAPGNVGFKLKLKGERVLDVELIPGFLHRGFEKMMENRWWEVNVVLSSRYCVEDPDNMELGYVLAVDDLYGVEVPEKANHVRTVVAEMSRIQSHLFWIMFMGAGLGARYIPSWAMAAREEILKWYDYLTGHRIYHHYMVPGGIRWNVPQDFNERTLHTLNTVSKIVRDIEEAFIANRIVRERTEGVGVVKGSIAVELGVSGPTLRAAGIPYDIRKADPYASYGKVSFEVPVGSRGDSYDRIKIRVKEIYESIKIIEQLLPKINYEDKAYRLQLPTIPPNGEGLGRVEAARGEYLVHVVNLRSRYPYRVRIRPPSMPLLTTVLKYIVSNEEVTIADFPVIVKSLDPCAPDIDR